MRWGIALTVVCALVASREARADNRAKRVVRVEIAAGPGELASLEAVLRDVLSGLDVSAEMTAVPRIDATHAVLGQPGDPNAILGRAFLDLSNPERATVYLVDAKWERILVRHVPATANSEILHETVGRIVSTGVEALLAGSFGEFSKPVEHPPVVAAIAAPPVETVGTAKTAPSRAPEAKNRATLRSRIGVYYEAILYSSAKPLTHGPGLAGEVEFGERRLRPAIWITAQYRVPILDADPPIGLRLDMTAARALAGVALDLDAAFTLESGIGLGVDVMHLAPRFASAGDAAYLTEERWFARGLGRAMVGARWNATRSFSVEGALVVDIDVSGSRFTVDRDATQVPVIAPYPLRPGLAFGVSLP